MKHQKLKKNAAKMRRKPTYPERVLCAKLFQWKIQFCFQWIVKGYVADFYLPAYKTIIETDGKSHFTYWGTLRDAKRNRVLEEAGFTVLHINNQDIPPLTKEDLLSLLSGTYKQPSEEAKSFHNHYLSTLK